MVTVAELDRRYPDNFPARVTILMQGCAMHEKTVMKPTSDPSHPLSANEIAEKFRDNSAAPLGAA